MLVPAVAALDALFYLYHLPLYLALRLTWEGGLRFGAGFAAVNARAALASADRAAGPRHRPKASEPGRGFLLTIARHVHVDASAVTGRLALGDAAATALGCGVLNMLASALPGARPGGVLPDFGAAAPGLELQALVSLRAGPLAAAAARAALERPSPHAPRPFRAQWLRGRATSHQAKER